MSSTQDPQRALSRRQLLKGATLGLAAGGVGGFARIPQATAQDSSEDYEITGGDLVDRGSNVLEVKAGEEVRRVRITGETSVWKGGESLPPALKKGDDLMVKVRSSDDVALRVWSNLTRIEGTLVDASKSGYVVRTDGPHTPKEKVGMELADGVLFGDYTADGNVSRRDLKRGAMVDAIGERLPGGNLRATMLYVHDPDEAGAVPQDAANPPDVNGQPSPDGDVQAAYYGYTYYGHATWFYCGNGAGSCGYCNTSYNAQGAWPALGRACNCCSYNCCNCSAGCRNQVRLGCGSTVSVYSYCTGYRRTIYIVDCGPKQSDPCGSWDLCNRPCRDCYGYYTPIVDLTRPSFAAFGYDPAYQGCFSCYAYA